MPPPPSHTTVRTVPYTAVPVNALVVILHTCRNNDGGADIDCADSDCIGDSACSGGCVPPVEICDDGIDNDCDGKTDCADRKDCKNFPGC